MLVVLGTAAVAGNAAHASSLCGVAFAGRSDLDAKLRHQQARFFVGEGVTAALASSPTALTLWWFTEPKSRAYPAVACVEKRGTPDRGFVLGRGQVDCGGISAAECGRLRRDISRAKF